MNQTVKFVGGKLLAVVGFTGLVLVALALPKHESQEAGRYYTAEPEMPQIVLQFDHKEPDGSIIVIPKGLVLLKLMPMKPIAPLPGGSLMICRGQTQELDISESKQGVSLGKLTEIGYKCGSDVLIFRAMDVHQEK